VKTTYQSSHRLQQTLQNNNRSANEPRQQRNTEAKNSCLQYQLTPVKHSQQVSNELTENLLLINFLPYD